MNRIDIDRHVYDLGKVAVRRMSKEEWDSARQHLRRNDKAHVVRIGNDLFYVIDAKFDPKYNMIDMHYRSMTLAFVMPTQTRDDSEDDRPSIRRLRRENREL